MSLLPLPLHDARNMVLPSGSVQWPASSRSACARSQISFRLLIFRNKNVCLGERLGSHISRRGAHHVHPLSLSLSLTLPLARVDPFSLWHSERKTRQSARYTFEREIEVKTRPTARRFSYRDEFEFDGIPGVAIGGPTLVVVRGRCWKLTRAFNWETTLTAS